MTIKEMHIEVEQATQQVASAINRKFYPEEIDWILNKVIDRVVASAIKPKDQTDVSDFEEYQIDVDKIHTLLESKAIHTREELSQYVIDFPDNYKHLIEDYSYTTNSCGPAITSRNATRYITELRLVPSVKASAPYYTNLSMSVNGTGVLVSSDVPNNIEDKGMLFTVIDAIRDLIPSRLPAGIEMYWERAGSIYKPNTLILISYSPVAASISYDSTTIQGTQTNEIVKLPSQALAVSQRVNRLTKRDRVGKLQQSTFSKTRYNSPISVQEKGSLKVFSDNTFIVTQVLISYVRKPLKVSLILGKNCDLPDSVHQHVCDLAAEYIKLLTQDPGYTAKLQDNRLHSN